MKKSAAEAGKGWRQADENAAESGQQEARGHIVAHIDPVADGATDKFSHAVNEGKGAKHPSYLGPRAAKFLKHERRRNLHILPHQVESRVADDQRVEQANAPAAVEAVDLR